ncbi:MAG: hypothetical protein WA484_08890 [Solirubrobacteraceae bacterium]
MPVSGEIAEPPDPKEESLPIGGTPDLSTAYFTYAGTLGLPEDAARAPHSTGGAAWGFYEYRNGVLSEAGVLPDGSVNQYGAVPAAIAPEQGSTRGPVPDQFDNEVSSDGSRVFLVSPDPRSSLASPNHNCSLGCTDEPPQLYVRQSAPDGSQTTTLVSQSQLAGQLGQPAPDGPVALYGTPPTEGSYGGRYSSYVFASSDGSHAFFASTDQLTESAPADSTVKEYDFDVNTGLLTYLPGVTGSIAAVAGDGSSLVFENIASSPFELDRWVAGPGGGVVTPIVQLPEPERCHWVCVGPAHISADGSVIVFETNSRIPGFNDGGFMQVFRYDAASNELACASCPPTGVAPSGNAVMSNLSYQGVSSSSGNDLKNGVVDTRGMSSDGARIFFDTPDPLVPQDANGKVIELGGEFYKVGRDVYEWENGNVFLISSATSGKDSLYLDSSPNGDDVFFATDVGLVPGDTEGGFDVYDARSPHPGDNPPPSAVPCQGEVCQGPPSVPSLLGEPSSATFDGLGNVVQSSESKPVVKKKAVAKKKKTKARKKRGKRARKASERGGKGGRR